MMLNKKLPYYFFLTLVSSLAACSGDGSDGVPLGDHQQMPVDETSSETEPSTGVPDQATPHSTRVNFDITVPFYLSDELQVRLVSGDRATAAMWVTGVSWTLVEDFPANTDIPLMFTFYDENGGIELGSVDTNFRSGNGPTDFFQVTADQWDIDRWDYDNDGISNLEELWQGSDPYSANNTVQPLAANFVHSFSFLPRIESSFFRFESDIPELAGLVNINEESLPGENPTTTRNINLSAEGNGTFSDTWYNRIEGDFDAHRYLTGTRSSHGDTVRWSGVTESASGSTIAYRTNNEVFDVSSTINGRELRQSATSTVTFPSFSGSRRLVHSYDIRLDLDSRDSEGKCAVLQGSMSQTREVKSVETGVDETGMWEQEQVYTATRSSANVRWEWSMTIDDNITIGESTTVANRFYCDFQFQPSIASDSDETFTLRPEIEWASSLYESELQTYRLPANIQHEMSVQSSEYQRLLNTRDINISAEGNGTFSGVHIDEHTWIMISGGDFEANSSGTRSSQENTVSWSGTELVTGRSSHSSYEENAFETTSTIIGNELMQTGSGTVSYRVNATFVRRYQYDIVLDLSSINSERKCSVLRGLLSITGEYFNEDSNSFELVDEATASRSSSDESWAWTSTLDGEIQSGLTTDLGNRFHCDYLFNQRF